MKIGILGVGSIGMRHFRNLRAMGHDIIAWDPVADNDAGIPSRERVIAAAEALIIASPTSQHYQDLVDCMATGKPTFVEKPIAATHIEWSQLQNFESTKQLFVGFNLRFHRGVMQAKQWLEGGTIGKPIWARFAVAQKSERRDYLRDGVILNWASHEVDLALHLLGPACVKCAAADEDETLVDMVLEHANGCRSIVHADYLTSPEHRAFHISGENGMISVSLPDPGLCCLNSTVRAPHNSFDENYVAEMRAFLDRIEGKQMRGATGEDGLAALGICLDAKLMAGASA